MQTYSGKVIAFAEPAAEGPGSPLKRLGTALRKVGCQHLPPPAAAVFACQTACQLSPGSFPTLFAALLEVAQVPARVAHESGLHWRHQPPPGRDGQSPATRCPAPVPMVSVSMADQADCVCLHGAG